jgi:antitoxin MazE
MITKIKKWGNSQGLRFPRDILRQVNISLGDDVDVKVLKGEIVVKPASPARKKYLLKDLVSKMPATYKIHEEKWGKPMGKESW